MSYYTGNQPGNEANIGLLPEPYYWWEAGAMFMSMINYASATGDTSYNEEIQQAIVTQAGSNNDFYLQSQLFDMVSQIISIYQTRDHANISQGNDDQAFWGFVPMTAVEYNFPANPNATASYLEMASNVFNEIAARWDTSSCGGGLRWQAVSTNTGYDYKNSVANGAFFLLAARLGRYTGNQTYLDWAEKTWNWTTRVGLIDENYNVYDGTDDTSNCTSVDHDQWSYNIGLFLYGSALMQNVTGSETWTNHTNGLVKAATLFFTPFQNATDVMYEPNCEKGLTCNTDQWSFKAYLSSWMGSVTQVAPDTASTIKPLLAASAQGAACACSGGADGTTCGAKWYIDNWDGTNGVGQQMSAMSSFVALLAKDSPPPRKASDAVQRRHQVLHDKP